MARTWGCASIGALGLWVAGCGGGGGHGGPAGDAAAVSSGATGAVGSFEARTLEELVAMDVVYEDLSPEHVRPAPVTLPGSTLSSALFTRGPDGLALSAVVEAPEGWSEPEPVLTQANARWRLEGSAGARLAEGEVELPVPCDCGAAEDHQDGCVVSRHVLHFRLDLPRLASEERLVLSDLAGAELGAWDLSVSR